MFDNQNSPPVLKFDFFVYIKIYFVFYKFFATWLNSLMHFAYSNMFVTSIFVAKGFGGRPGGQNNFFTSTE